MDVKEEDILGDSVNKHWYYISKGRALLSMLQGISADHVIDVGAGSGYFSRLLADASLCNSVECVDPAYTQEKHIVINNIPVDFVRQSNSPSASIALMMDVIEHVDDDLGLISRYADHLAPGGHMLITVPAFNWLWSAHDDFLEHKRRYTIGSLSKVVSAAGLKIVANRYFFALILPIAVPVRLVEKMSMELNVNTAKSSLKHHSDLTNIVLVKALDFERKWLFKLNRIAGLSVFCLARKPQ